MVPVCRTAHVGFQVTDPEHFRRPLRRYVHIFPLYAPALIQSPSRTGHTVGAAE